MTEGQSEEELTRNLHETFFCYHLNTGYDISKLSECANRLIAFLDAKAERAFEAGRIDGYRREESGYPGITYQQWNESQRGGDEL